eukprot:8454430-Pyramimonas_sp.AAC.1
MIRRARDDVEMIRRARDDARGGGDADPSPGPCGGDGVAAEGAARLPQQGARHAPFSLPRHGHARRKEPHARLPR